MNKTQFVGNPTPRVEGAEKVTGKAVYAVDVVLPGMLWGKAMRSPVPYARIRRVDVSRALALPGVKTVITGKDVAGHKIGRRIYDMPILAEEVVRFIGEKVAAVAADTEEIAEQALGLIEVEYEDLKPVLDPLEALKPTAPLLHPDVMGYRGLPWKLQQPSNAFVQTNWKKGDVEEGFRQSDAVVENIFRTQSVHHAYIEPHSCVVKADPSGGAEIWSCSKVPFALREQVSNALGVPPAKLVIRPCYIGGDFGGKGDFMDVPLCYFLSLKSSRPVKMVMDYEEEFIAGNPRHASVIRVKTGVKRDGTVLAQHFETMFDSGAYAAFKPLGFLSGAQAAAGPYRVPHLLIEERCVYTNKIPCGHMRAPGDPQSIFANECQIDLVARHLGMDPIEFRKKNLLRDGEVSPTGHALKQVKAIETLAKALDGAGYYKAKPKNVGRGVALAEWHTAGGETYVFVTIDERGRITVASAMMDQGAGTATVMRQIVAEELKVPLEWVGVVVLDTTKVPTDSGVGGSRATRMYGMATCDAAAKARDELLKIAAERMDCPAELLKLVKGSVTTPNGRRRMTFAQIVKAKGEPINVQGHYKNTERSGDVSMCAQVAEVEVDRETGQVRLRKFTSSHSTGTIINPLMHQGQIEGGVVMGIGYALMEHLVIEDGKVVSANFGDSKIPAVQDIPDLKTVILPLATGPGPYHSMSIGETSIIPVAAAVANALHDAVGVRLRSLPITAEKVFEALNGRRRA